MSEIPAMGICNSHKRFVPKSLIGRGKQKQTRLMKIKDRFGKVIRENLKEKKKNKRKRRKKNN